MGACFNYLSLHRLYLYVVLFFCVPLVCNGDSHFLGRTYVSVSDIASRYKLKTQVVKEQKSVKLQGNAVELVFEVHHNDCLINGKKVYLGFPTVLHKHELWITKQDLEYTVLPILTPSCFNKKPKLLHIVLDAGHGGKDHGTQNKPQKLLEKKLTLDTVMRLQKILKTKGFKVSCTRHSDKFVDLHKRSEIANSLNADLFISVHYNSAVSNVGEVYGVETYVLPPQNQPSTGRSRIQENDKQAYPGNTQDPWNMLVGYYVQGSIIDSLNVPDRGLKKARFAVFRDLLCPGILIECGFLSHPKESYLLSQSDYREKIAQAIASGIVRYQKVLEKIAS